MHPLCLKIIDTPEFQRLRSLKQCGISYLVYPSAVHTRFEHCIGVYHLAGKVLDQLRKDLIAENGPAITDEEHLCVRIAALCHDLGHGPFSHTWERFVHIRTRQHMEHEDMSLKIFNHLIENNNLHEEFQKYNLNDESITFIENIIAGKRENMDPNKLFLMEIVANKKTNIDVDKFDYMMRDALFFGVNCAVRFDRIISQATVIQVGSENHQEYRIAFRDKVCDDLLEIFKYRAKLHKICYQHRVCKLLEIMLIDALIEADEVFFEDGMALSNCHNNVEKYISLNDGLMDIILSSQNKILLKSQKILKNIQTRKLYFRFNETLHLLEMIPMTAMKELESSLNSHFSVSLRLAVVDNHLGIKNESPLENVIFYSKQGNIVRPHITEQSTGDREILLLVFAINEIGKELQHSIITEIKKHLHIEV